MSAPAPDRRAVVDALRRCYAAITEVTEHIEGAGGGLAGVGTGCAGWHAGDLLFHQLCDARRALVALNTPGDRAPDRDAVTYWLGFPGRADTTDTSDTTDDEHARFVRAVTAAYPPGALVAEWRATAAAAVVAAQRCPHPAVGTQGHVLTTTDFLDTLVVEATVHHLDLTAEVPDAPAADPDGLRRVRRVLDGLLGHPAPFDWDDRTYALKGTGRLPLTGAETALADRFPLFG
ncbi:maleylpyruvate isomerase N-terminal domain-containing protein [Actinokineospora bangkokensis]|uniref:Mycothiol-dependent maleylpyruvate isomerase metal-binding domain-containing protein n=1 Tax=Actinokineospora bangkokensis TaxID=1193682 RepID=A0A1Q9LP81_9PSEU|nr:maleylpyruvate isomerase N-terminal domain-containing protein [Actinokineospora bangkokensis]OLR93825.1 hypothetical protein BJP25_16495 [Actinokineospora bangkokensis]